MTDKAWIRLKYLLVFISVLATVKLIFVDYTMDEEYQIVMSYRRIFGDTLFGTMWEPHQTSSFVCTLLMRPFLKVTGGTAWLIVYLRSCTACIQLLLSVWVYNVFCRITDKNAAFLLGVCYFNLVPKLIQIPEFSNLQLWFFTMIVLSLNCYYYGERKKRWVFLSAVGMAMEVLAYPACLVLFPFFCCWIVKKSAPGEKIKDVAFFAGTCGICAFVWCGVILSQVGIEEFLRNLKLVIAFDSTHDLSMSSEIKHRVLLTELTEAVRNMAICYGLGFLGYTGYIKTKFVLKKEKATESVGLHVDKTILAVFIVLASEIVQLIYWLVLQQGYEKPQVVSLVVLSVGLWIYKESDNTKEETLPGIIGTVLVVLGVMYMSDLGLYNAMSHAVPGVLLSLVLLVNALKKARKEQNGRWILVLLCSLCFLFIFGKGFTVKYGRTPTNTILGVQNVVREGPAKGIFTNYLQGYILNSAYEDYEKFLQPGEKCLIVTTMVNTAGTTPYLFEHYEVCHFSIVDPTTYDEKLLTYWELYPQKQPDVIAIDCWYGQPMIEDDSWIMQYIEKEFGYTEIFDGKYTRFYRR